MPNDLIKTVEEEMTRDEITAEYDKIARKTKPFDESRLREYIVYFAQHIAKLEREACARICSDKFEKWEYTLQDPRMLAKEILARGDE